MARIIGPKELVKFAKRNRQLRATAQHLSRGADARDLAEWHALAEAAIAAMRRAERGIVPEALLALRASGELRLAFLTDARARSRPDG